MKTVQQNKDDYGLPLKILSYKELYGWTMDEIVAEVYIVISGKNHLNLLLNFCSILDWQKK